MSGNYDDILAGMKAMMPEGYKFQNYYLEEGNYYSITFRTENGRFVNLLSKDSMLDLQGKLMPRIRMERKAESIAKMMRREGVTRHLEFDETVNMVLAVIMVLEMNEEYNMIKIGMEAGK